ncbi:protein of unknown function [Paenibacillus uliginis N3/975]|uniref:Copper amine oxidase N-terminal domain-containing protein n=1 Tax=Paenibacillus uliginis N3/975 TaxID=1313296 RepID=A0A1X7HSH2_9BACL|nr:stalk domain-containing protein [Paenibacillus uliginis]SMF91895.1 protein of unknown function [Paenibacillus uliginis N3/975]
MKMHTSSTPLKKKLAYASMAGVILLSGSFAMMTEVHALSAAKPQATAVQVQKSLVTFKTLKSSEPALEANIRIPVFQGLKDTKYQDQLNDIIESHASKDLAHMEKEAKEMAAKAKKENFTLHPYTLNINYELTADGKGTLPNLISLKVITEVTTGNSPAQRVDTYNFMDEKEAKRITLEDLFGTNYKQMIDSKIKSDIAANAEKYFAGKDGFQGIDSEQSFYVTGGKAVVVFQEYSIAPGVTGTPEFTFELTDTDTTNPVKTVIDPKSTFKAKNGTVMIPLADVLRSLQFDVKWNKKTKTADISKGAVWTSVTVGKDAYSFGKKAPQKLGASPVLKKGRVYVPLNFLTDILHAETVKGANGAIEVTLK